MGQRANNAGRNAGLDDQKARAAGRQNDRDPASAARRDANESASPKDATAGAFGKDDAANTRNPSSGPFVAGGSGTSGETDANHLRTGTKRK
jgi:hypothetical protein